MCGVVVVFFMCVRVFCFLTLITCLCGLRIHRVIVYVMFCVLVRDLLNVLVCLACVCCVVLYGVCLRVFACVRGCFFCLRMCLCVDCVWLYEVACVVVV